MKKGLMIRGIMCVTGIAGGCLSDPVTVPDWQVQFSGFMEESKSADSFEGVIAEAQIVKAEENRYCMGRTALCGKTPKCGHPGILQRDYTFKKGKQLWSATGADVQFPDEWTFSQRVAPGQRIFKAGDKVNVALAVYTPGGSVRVRVVDLVELIPSEN